LQRTGHFYFAETHTAKPPLPDPVNEPIRADLAGTSMTRGLDSS